MKKSKLIELLSCADEEFVQIEVDGMLYNIDPELGHSVATAYPAVAFLKLSEADEDEDINDY